ncbi:hypothetical protein C8T65DRAFT_165065 [Cerioporus squamosus]|nr:hypothetical protein C8T65DRAFT_165065 [Cerioporus squamosus]
MDPATAGDEVVLRAENLQGPFYGLQPLDITTADTSPQFLIRLNDLPRHFAGISALLNSRAPVNQLPNEILLAIFTFLQATVQEDAAPDWLAVLLVCRRWFVVAATAPQLWRELVVGKSLKLLRTGLVRSKGLTFGVSVIKRDAVPATARTLLPHVHRLHRLLVSSIHQRHKAYFVALMQRSMAALKSLTAIVEEPVSWSVNAENPSLTITWMPLSVDKFPKLRSLAVEKIFIPPSPDAVYQRLTVLRLLKPGIRDHREFEQILRSCHNVEELDLDLDGTAGHADPNLEKIRLPKLRAIRLAGWRWALNDVFKTIAIPPTASLDIHLSGPDDDVLREESISAILPEDYPTSLPIFSSVTEVHAQARQSEDIVVAYAPAPAESMEAERRRLSLRMPVNHKKGEDPQTVKRSLRKLSVFAAAPVESLSIDIEAKLVDYVSWPTVLGHFPLLRKLTVTVQGGSPQPSRVLLALASPASNAAAQDGHETATDGAARLLCPRLRLRVLHMHGFRSTSHPDDRWMYPVQEMDISADVSGPLSKRQVAGCDALEELVLDLDCVDEQKWATVDERRTACRRALESLVGKVEYEERKNWRDVFVYKDEMLL